MFNNLFNKNKYDVKPENNNPQRVYGVPNRYDQKAKYDIKPERNEPRLVYGPPEVILKLIEEEEKKNGKELFSAFQSEYAGPSHYYYVNKFQGKYQFRYGYTDNGAYVDNKIDNPALKIVEQDEDYYNNFMKELLPIIKDWNDSYLIVCLTRESFPHDIIHIFVIFKLFAFSENIFIASSYFNDKYS